jgi:hypothetical protein
VQSEVEHSNPNIKLPSEERLLPENVPLPEDEGPSIPSLMVGTPSIEGMLDIDLNVDGSLSDMANELSDSLLTSFARDGASSSAAASPSNIFRPKATQASEENLALRRFFANDGVTSDDGSEGSF